MFFCSYFQIYLMTHLLVFACYVYTIRQANQINDHKFRNSLTGFKFFSGIQILLRNEKCFLIIFLPSPFPFLIFIGKLAMRSGGGGITGARVIKKKRGVTLIPVILYHRKDQDQDPWCIFIRIKALHSWSHI